MRRFGRRLYDAFFRSYTEKVWGMPGSEIRAEWAAQRIQELQPLAGVRDDPRTPPQHVTTLIEEFLYPRLGPGPDVGVVHASGSRTTASRSG